MEVRVWSLITVVLVASLLSGCMGETGDEELYTHHWFWGPSEYSFGGLPVFLADFEVPDDVEQMDVQVDWNIGSGRAAIELTPPGEEVMNVTDTETEGPDGEGSFQVTAAAGTWGFRIPTWRADDGEFPSGEVEVVVVAT